MQSGRTNVIADAVCASTTSTAVAAAETNVLTEQPELSAQPGSSEDTMTSAIAPADYLDIQVVVICYFEKSVATASNDKTSNELAKEGFLAQTKELTTSQVALSKSQIASKNTWTLLFDEEPQHILT